MLLIIVWLEAAALWQGRVQAFTNAQRTSESVLNSLGAAIERNLLVLDASLMGIQKAMSLPEIDTMPASVRQLLLFNSAETAEFVGSILVLNADGTVRFDSRAIEPRYFNASDRSYFNVQRVGDAGLFISQPMKSRLQSKDGIIVLSRRISDVDGNFEGVAAATLRLAFFRTLFAGINLGERGIIAILSSDGVIITRSPATDRDGNAGMDLSRSSTFRRIQQGDGSFTGVAAVDGVERHYLSRQIGSYPLFLSVAFAPEDVLAPWRFRAVLTGVVVLGMCLAILVLFIKFQALLRRSFELQDMLAAAAATDTLTGLFNRREFDRRFDLEWRRCARNGSPISLLLVDGDRFKSVNDTHGHKVGDQVLQMIAQKIERVVRRPADVSARYGGEEFAIILPDTRIEGATAIAESIREKVSRSEVVLDHGVPVRTTVSIGVACVVPTGRMEKDDLFVLADAALYKAKSSGRNRVEAVPALEARGPVDTFTRTMSQPRA
ncbi:GGDEF domain-containing protein [Aquabacter sp. L1I39]|uniref:GGDEF domain-containing protein n=1 Tax=Aquabacter sp. L1I39 TaxID=2820278 RepID=UPI001ADD2A50|nr:sensor domain-containing diguanylate cyclase [Aquabacter sp. L1I39]QTL01953.1 GGDEF domain-containing protein [Aquabacter sp. L1I39]